MANANGWGDGASNNNIGWGKGADNAIGWGSVYSVSEAGETDIIGAPAFDPAAAAFFTAANITDSTQKTAVNQLVLDLKSFGLFTLPNLVVYPMVGGTNTSTSFNLVNPALYQITWNGGVVSSNNGVQFNGVNAYGNTNFNPTTVGAGQNSFHISMYSRTNNSNAECEIGVEDSLFRGSSIFARLSGTTYYRVNSDGIYITHADANSLGFYISNRTASNVVNGWKNGVKLATGTTASTGNVNANIFIGAYNNVPNPFIRYYSTKQVAAVTMGAGLTDTQAADLRTAIQTFNTTLARQV